MSSKPKSTSADRKLFDIESPLAIELRRIMIRLGRSLDFDRKLSMMVSSAESGEGKSTFALHFALVLAYHLQRRVLLVDGDVRRPVQHKVFEEEIAPGLADLLTGEVGLKAAIRKTDITNLDVLTAGLTGGRPSRLFNPEKIKALIQELHKEYDLIIVDSPPVVPVSDPLLYTQAIDGLIFLVMAGRTPKEVSLRGIEIFKSAGANILGVVANNLGEVLPYYYSSKYYGYDKKK